MNTSTLNHRRNDRLITAFVIVAVIALVGILIDSWQVVFLSVPALISVLFVQGSLTENDTLDPRAMVVVGTYLAGLFALFLAVVVTANSTARMWGLPVSMGVIFYLIWPYTAIASGLIYAYVFGRNTTRGVSA